MTVMARRRTDGQLTRLPGHPAAKQIVRFAIRTLSLEELFY